MLGAALVQRLLYFRRSVAADIRAPDRVFGFFTITAWAAVAAAFLARLARHPEEPASRTPAPSPGTAATGDTTMEKELP